MGEWCGPIENQRGGADARRLHGMSASPAYSSWRAMLAQALEKAENSLK